MDDQAQKPTDDLEDQEVRLEDEESQEPENSTISPDTLSEQGIGGDADPDSDDNALDAAQEAGIGQGADEEHPQPLNIAKDVEDAERAA